MAAIAQRALLRFAGLVMRLLFSGRALWSRGGLGKLCFVEVHENGPVLRSGVSWKTGLEFALLPEPPLELLRDRLRLDDVPPVSRSRFLRRTARKPLDEGAAHRLGRIDAQVERNDARHRREKPWVRLGGRGR